METMELECSNGAEGTAPLARGGISTSTSTCDLRRFAPPVLASDPQAERQDVQQPKSNLPTATKGVSNMLGCAGEANKYLPKRVHKQW